MMDVPGKLQLRFDDHGDGTGRLLIRASSNGFAGEGVAWFSVNEIEDFAAAIGVYPIPEDGVPLIVGGYFKKTGAGILNRNILRLGFTRLTLEDIWAFRYKLQRRFTSKTDQNRNIP